MIAVARTRRAVLVNDDPVQLEWLADSLRKLGLDVVGFPDGAEALRGLRGSDAPDLVVVDLHMPRVDGWRFCRALRSPEFRNYNDTPLLVTSATYSGIDVEEITAELGANAFLPIPFSPGDLEKHVGELLAGRSPKASLSFLIVDPAPDVRVPVARRLNEEGYRVITAEGGLEAMDRMRDLPRVDVVLVSEAIRDMVVGDFVRDVKERTPRTSVLVSTDGVRVGVAVDMLCAGADSTIHSPFSPESFMELVHKTLRERSILGIREILEARTRELWSSEARYRTLFQVMPEALVLLDRDGQVVQANPVAQRLLGAKPSELVGRDLLSLLPGSARPEAREYVQKLWRGEVDRFEGVLTPLVGVPVEVEITGRAVEFTGRRALLIVARDLSERRRAESDRLKMEAQIQHVQRLESLGTFAGGIAHDFNNLLAGITGYASLLRMELPDDGEEAEILEQIELSARRAGELASQILAYSGRSKLALAPSSVSDLVGEMGTLIAPAISKKADIQYDLPEVPPVLMDSSLLRQVVMNLLVNASDSLGGDMGAIGVRTGVAWNTPGLFAKALTKTALDAEQYVFLEIEDSGCGMDAGTVSRIFDPFYTTKDSGRGLGLAATLGIVWQHGGAVEVQSIPGQGTTFRVWLPVDRTVSVEAAESIRSGDFTLRGTGRVLVAEDEGELRAMAVKALERFGFDVIQAGDGRETVELFERHHHELRLVMLDLSMPVLDGSEALQALRRINPAIPIVMTSGYRQLDMEPGEAMPDQMLWKPYSANELARALEAVLEDPTRATLPAM